MAVAKREVELLLRIAILLHVRIINATGGVHGVRDEGGLYHSLSKLLSRADKGMHPFELCAFAYREFSTRHHFNDGNKRFSHVFAKMTLFGDGFHLSTSYPQALPVIVQIADQKLSLSQIRAWLEPNTSEIGKRSITEYFENIEEDLRK